MTYFFVNKLTHQISMSKIIVLSSILPLVLNLIFFFNRNAKYIKVNKSFEYTQLSNHYDIYIPATSIKIKFGIRGENEAYIDDNHNFHAIQWPQETVEDTIERISFSNESIPSLRDVITIHNNRIRKDLLLQNENKMKNIMSQISAQIWPYKRWQSFWKYYNNRSSLHYDTQCTIVSAMSMFRRPKVLVFGSFDSPLLCKAASNMHPESEIYFLENDLKLFHAALKNISKISSRCSVIYVKFRTVVDNWIDSIGLETLMAENILTQLPPNVGTNFDVILIDGLSSGAIHYPWTLASISTVSKLLRQDGNGIVFVNDFDLYPVLLFSRFLLRPKLGNEFIVKGWGNSWKTVFFTNNKLFKKYHASPIMDTYPPKVVRLMRSHQEIYAPI